MTNSDPLDRVCIPIGHWSFRHFPMTLLEVKSLRTYFHAEHGLVKAVDDVSFRIEEGRTLGIVGESGSGKSVTSFSIMRLLAGAGVIEPGSKIALLGKDLVGLPEQQMRQVRGK